MTTSFTAVSIAERCGQNPSIVGNRATFRADRVLLEWACGDTRRTSPYGTPSGMAARCGRALYWSVLAIEGTGPTQFQRRPGCRRRWRVLQRRIRCMRVPLQLRTAVHCVSRLQRLSVHLRWLAAPHGVGRDASPLGQADHLVRTNILRWLRNL